jgi:hypothetical protein
LKESLIFLFSPQTFQKSLSLSSITRQSIKRERDKKRKEEKLQKSFSFEKRNSIFLEEKIFSKLIHVSPFSPRPFYHFKKPFPNHLKILDSFETIP